MENIREPEHLGNKIFMQNIDLWRQALQELLQTYSAGLTGAPLDTALENMMRRTRDLRKQLRKAVVDHVSDNFSEQISPLDLLIEAARKGDEKNISVYSEIFSDHAIKLVEVAQLAVSMSGDVAGVRLVRQAAGHVADLYEQVINAARILTLRSNSQVK